MHTVSKKQEFIEWMALSVIVVLAYLSVPSWIAGIVLKWFPENLRTMSGWMWTKEICSLLFAATLTFAAYKRNGIIIGNILQHWWKVLIVFLIPVCITIIIYPFVSDRPYSGASISMWLTNPIHQNLVFLGFIYGKFKQIASTNINNSIPVSWALLVTAIFFALYHIPNLRYGIPVDYVLFQVGYCFFGLFLIGLPREWTGSIIYGTCIHMAVNFTAWIIN